MPASATYVAGEPLVRRAAIVRPDGTRLRIERGTEPGARLDGWLIDPTALGHGALLQARRLTLGPAR